MKIVDYITKNLGIEIKPTRNYELAYTKFDPERGRFTIYYNPDNLKARSLEWALQHELMHIYRDDFTAVTREKLNPRLYNVASDYVINNVIAPPEELEKIVITKENAPCQCGLDYRQGAFVIYKHLLEEHTETMEISCFEPVDEGAAESAREESDRIRRRILEDFVEGKVPEQFGDNLDKMLKEKEKLRDKSYKSRAGASSAEFKIEYPKSSSKSNKIKNIIMRYLGYRDGNTEFWRLYRLHRRQRTEGIAREIEVLESRSVLFIIDVSGSMDEFINDILAAIASLEKEEMVVEKIYFSDDIKYTARREYYNVGGGTCFYPVLDFVRNRFYELVVVFSDYEFADIDKGKAIEMIRSKCRTLILFDEKMEYKIK